MTVVKTTLVPAPIPCLLEDLLDGCGLGVTGAFFASAPTFPGISAFTTGFAYHPC